MNESHIFNARRKAMRHLKRIQELVAQKPSPFARMSEQEVINHLRKTREELWEEKLASRPRQ